MAQAFKCDICGKFFLAASRREEVRFRNDIYDLCPICFKELISFTEKLKQDKEQKNNG